MRNLTAFPLIIALLVLPTIAQDNKTNLALDATQPATSRFETTTTQKLTTTQVASTTTTEQATQASSTPEPTTVSSASSPTPTAEASTATLLTTEEDSQPTTVTAPDSLSVNSDEAPTESSSAPSSSIVDTTEERGSSVSDEVGIEGKSINREDPGVNALSSDSNAKLTSIESTGTGEEMTSSVEQEQPTAKPSKNLNALPVHINMSQIDQVYNEGRKDEQATVDSWHRMNKKLKKVMGGLIGSVVPFALNMSAEAKISNNCSGAMLKWVLSMNQLKAWALRMMDASGKPIAGLLEGSLTMFGNYRQCLKIRAPDDDEIELSGEFREYFRGKYCIVQAKPWLPEKSRFYNLNTKLKALIDNENEDAWYDRTIFDELSEWLLAFNFVNIRMDVCVPSLCTREDIQKAVNFLVRGIDMKARVVRCETDAPNGSNPFSAAAAVETGSTDIASALVGASTEESANYFASFSQLGWVLVPIIAVILVTIASAVSMALGQSKAIDESDEADDFQSPSKIRFRQKGKINRAINSLSIHRSVKSHTKVDYEQLADDKPLALYGIRLLMVLWIIVVESAVNLKFEYLRELLMLKDLIFWWPMQFIINSSLQFDSIILLTAFTMSYKNCLNEGLNNIKSISRFVIDKYVRLMPSIMVMVALTILLPLMYRGPVWNDYVTRQSAVCQSTGWLNTVFLQNYLPYNEIVSNPSFLY